MVLPESKTISNQDGRIYKDFVSISSLSETTIFMRACRDAHSQAQAKNLYQAKEICTALVFKLVNSSVNFKQFNLAFTTFYEQRKRKLKNDKIRPNEIFNIRQKLLGRRTLNNEILQKPRQRHCYHGYSSQHQKKTFFA